jgi:hypothetical protein
MLSDKETDANNALKEALNFQMQARLSCSERREE